MRSYSKRVLEDATLEQYLGQNKDMFMSRPVQKPLDPYRRQGFKIFFPNVAQDIVGALQVHVEVDLMGTGEYGRSMHGWVSHCCSPQHN